MRLIDSFRMMLKSVKEEKAKGIDLARSLRKNAIGLQHNYGNSLFVKRVRNAADALEDMESTLLAITLNSHDQWAIDQANEALDRYRERHI